MSFPVTFSTTANAEAIRQTKYLERKRPGYGRKFQQGLEYIISELKQSPKRYAATIARSDMRCIRFPKPFNKSHSVYYKFDGKVVRILCVFPNRMDEKIWQGRQ